MDPMRQSSEEFDKKQTTNRTWHLVVDTITSWD